MEGNDPWTWWEIVLAVGFWLFLFIIPLLKKIARDGLKKTLKDINEAGP